MHTPKVPSYRRHSSGQAFVRVKGKNYYLGKHGTPAAHAEYSKFVGRFLLGRPLAEEPRSGPVVRHVVGAYQKWADDYYRKSGQATKQVQRIEIACGPLLDLFGDLPLESFAFLHFEKVQQEMVARGWTRGYVNTCVGCLKRFFKWCGLRGYVTMEGALRLAALPNLARGRTQAREVEAVRPVDLAVVEKTLPFLGEVPRAMVLCQLHGGMRPQEVRLMRPLDINRHKEPWVYIPPRHKNEHRGQHRIIFLGPRAREAIKPLLLAKILAGEEDRPLFSPRQAALAWHLEHHGCPPPKGFFDKLGDGYSTTGYSQAVERAAKRAGVPHWTPLQLRHTAGTLVRARYGPDKARAVLGHESLDSTEVYAELDLEAAARIAEEMG